MVLAIKVRIERFTQEWFPGGVECSFVDAAGNAHVFEEKVPIVSDEPLTAQSEYPREGVVACRAVGSRLSTEGREIVAVDTELACYIGSETERQRFEVFREQLVEFDDGIG